MVAEPSAQLDIRDATFLAQSVPLKGIPSCGDHLITRDGSLAMVWDSLFSVDKALVKIKYRMFEDGRLQKVPHAFSTPLLYRQWLARNCLTGDGFPSMPLVDFNHVNGLIPALPVAAGNIGANLDSLLELFANAGITSDKLWLTGSRSLGISNEKSDWDLIVYATPEKFGNFRTLAFAAMAKGLVRIPSSSGTWKTFDQVFPGGIKRIVVEQRFIETMEINGVSAAFMLVDPTAPQPTVPTGDYVRVKLSGRVIDAARTPYKKAMYQLETSSGDKVSAISYHKYANLLQVGDAVSVAGWQCESSGINLLIQLYSDSDHITWL